MQLCGCVSKTSIVVMQRSQSKILIAITNAPRYVINHTLHTDFNIHYVNDVIHERINNHHNKLIPIHYQSHYFNLQTLFFLAVALRPNAGRGLLILDVSRSHTTTQHSRQDSSGRVISSSQRPLPYNTQHSQQTDIHIPGGIRTHNLGRRAAAD